MNNTVLDNALSRSGFTLADKPPAAQKRTVLGLPFDRINWITSSFLIGTLLLTLTAVPLYLYHFGLDRFQVALFFVMLWACGFSITIGYHRFFSHITFQASWPIRLFTLIFGAAAFENSALMWASEHRRHHKHVDHDDDPYCLSKGGMRMLTRTAGLELAPHNICVVGVGPGAVDTPINAQTVADPAALALLNKSIPLGRLAEPEEIASVVAFLAGPGASYIAATTIFADGGIMQSSPGL